MIGGLTTAVCDGSDDAGYGGSKVARDGGEKPIREGLARKWLV